jgi:hypothetical protein
VISALSAMDVPARDCPHYTRTTWRRRAG